MGNTLAAPDRSAQVGGKFMRITGGRAGGIPLKQPRGGDTRPATDRLREAVFSFLGGRVAGAVFLDLFAGTGAYGLEAWSRGAVDGVLVEKNRAALAVLRENLRVVGRALGADGGGPRVAAADVRRWKPPPGLAGDLVFCDPPYEMIETVAPTVFHLAGTFLQPGGLLLFEMPGHLDLTAEGFAPLRRLGKGRHEPTCVIWEKTEPGTTG